MELKVDAGLQGKFLSGGTTELKVEITSLQATPTDLIISDFNGTTIRHLQLNEHHRKTLWVEVRPKNNGALTVTLLPEQGEPLTQSLFLSSTDSPITLVSITPNRREWRESMDNTSDSSTILLLASTGFPHTLPGYGTVRSIVTDLETVSVLDHQQSKALGGYLAGCGILLLDDASPAILRRLTDNAGCGGRFIKGYENLSDVPPLIRQLTTQLPPKLPSITELTKLHLTQDRMPPVIYLSGYLLFMALLAAATKQTVFLLVFPLLTASAGLIVWYGEGNQHLTLWAETESGDPHARYTAILRTGGDRRGLQQTIFAQNAVLTRKNDDYASAAPARYINGNGGLQLQSKTALFSPAIYRLEGILHHPKHVTLSLEKERPKVSNQSGAASPSGRLLWQGRSYQVPVLSPDETWYPESPEAAFTNPAEQLLRRRLSYDSAALLYPFSPDIRRITPSATQASGWLVIRPTLEHGT